MRLNSKKINVRIIGRILSLVLSSSLLLISCAKDKLDNPLLEVPDHQDQGELSPIRIVNAAEFLNVEGNGDSLSSFLTADPASPPPAFYGPWIEYPPTERFPDYGFLKQEWRIPQALFRGDHIDLFFSYVYGYPNLETAPTQIKTGKTIKNTDNANVDYYLGWREKTGEFFYRITRDETPPSSPDKIKIRLLNLDDSDLSYSLVYADGSSVNDKTNMVASSKASEYIELPYGSYQFRVMMEGRQIPYALAAQGDLVDPVMLSFESMIDYHQPSKDHYIVPAPIYAYQPGGTYTIFVYPSHFVYFETGALEPTKFYAPTFRIVQDNQPVFNTQYCRIQHFNAFPDDAETRIRINGEVKPDVKYASASAYWSLAPGDTKIELMDEKGNVLTALQQVLEGNQNYTICSYPDTKGKPQLLVFANNMANLPGRRDMMPFAKRYINLCPDIPYATFTSNDGNSMGDTQVNNLQPGQNITQDPYLFSTYAQDAYEILAYRSDPNRVPGTWADDIAVLHGYDFIANTHIYDSFGGALPVHEPGYYTVALVGRVGEHVPEPQKAKMVIIKHNK